MVLPDSHEISRAPCYLGSHTTGTHVSVTGVSPSTPPLPKGFTYTRTFHCVLTRQYQPHGPTTPQTQPLPSITRSWFGLFRFLSPILTEYLFLPVLRCFTSRRSLYPAYTFSREYLDMTPGGFPHSDTLGSQLVCQLPEA